MKHYVYTLYLLLLIDPERLSALLGLEKDGVSKKRTWEGRRCGPSCDPTNTARATRYLFPTDKNRSAGKWAVLSQVTIATVYLQMAHCAKNFLVL